MIANASINNLIQGRIYLGQQHLTSRKDFPLIILDFDAGDAVEGMKDFRRTILLISIFSKRSHNEAKTIYNSLCTLLQRQRNNNDQVNIVTSEAPGGMPKYRIQNEQKLYITEAVWDLAATKRSA